MKTRFGLFLGCVSGLVGIALTGCGAATHPNIVKEVKIGTENEFTQISVKFADEMTLLKGGNAVFSSTMRMDVNPTPTEKGFEALLTLAPGAFAANQQQSLYANALPNGTAFPLAGATQLQAFRTVLPNGLDLTSYFSTSEDNPIAAMAIGLPFVDEHFPKGISVSQKLMNKDGIQVGVAGFYGPGLKKGNKIPGGVFVVTKLSGILPAEFSTSGWYRSSSVNDSDSGSGNTIGIMGWHRINSVNDISIQGWHRINSVNTGMQPADDFDVTGPNAIKYKSTASLYRLLQMFQFNGQQSGWLK